MRSGKDGFTLLEMLIAMGILAFVLAVFLAMIVVAGQITAENRRDLQRAYTKLAVLEIVRSNPGCTVIINEDDPEEDPDIYNGFFPTSWPEGSGFREIKSILVQGTDLLRYSTKPLQEEWKAKVEHEQSKVYVSVTDVASDY